MSSLSKMISMSFSYWLSDVKLIQRRGSISSKGSKQMSRTANITTSIHKLFKEYCIQHL